MSPHDQHIISLSVDANDDAEVIKAFEVLSRVAASLALDGIEIRMAHYRTSDLCECDDCESYRVNEEEDR